MKKYKSIAIFFVMCILVILPVKASEQEYTTSVQYSSGEKRTQTFLLEVNGNGRISDGNQIIKNGSIEYQLRIGDEKTFTILPDEGYKVTHIYYRVTSKNKEAQTIMTDLIEQMVDNTITIKIVEGKIELNIAFEKDEKTGSSIPEESIPPSEQVPPDSTMNISPSTGEVRNILLYGMFIVSYFTLLHVRSRVRKEYLREQLL